MMDAFDYYQEFAELQPSLFRESDNLHRLFQTIFKVYDTQQEDLLWLSQNILNIDLAEKSHLDFIGSLVGQPRFLSNFNTEPYFGYEGSYQSKTFGSSLDPEVGGYWNSRSYFNTATARQLNDDEYRRLIKARVIYNQSNCTANDLIEVVNLITGSNNNTVQLLQHGLIQISTDDDTGILSYFVDRLYLEDNILPVAAGVRIGLEQSATDNSGGGTLDTDWEVKKLYEGSTGSKVGIDAVRIKNNLEVESSIEVTPTVGQISDRIKSGEYGAEVNKAVLDIDAEATDWVLNLTDNSVRYVVGSEAICTHKGTGATAPDLQSLCTAVAEAEGGYVRQWEAPYLTCHYTRGTGTDVLNRFNEGMCITTAGTVKHIPIDTVAAQVITNAEAGHTESKSLLLSVVSVLASMKFYDSLF